VNGNKKTDKMGVKRGHFVIYFDKKMACWYLIVGQQKSYFQTEDFKDE
jgi:hypothetical protein